MSSAATAFVPREGPHKGHTIRVVAADMPHFYETPEGEIIEPGARHSWFECECGEAWEATVDDCDNDVVEDDRP